MKTRAKAESFAPLTAGVTTDAFDALSVSLEPGVSLVEASAGTGKTFSITQLVLRLLLDRKADGSWRVGGIGNILVVTFTNAATAELTTRVRAMLREAVDVFSAVVTERTTKREYLFALRDQHGDAAVPRLREALASLDQLSIHTIHGWCRRVLEENALESGTPFGAQFLEEDAQLLERMAQDWWRRTMYEDEQLAALAVHERWSHDSFLKDLKTWQRLPDVRLEPGDALPVAREAVARAMTEFARTWDADAARGFLESVKWLARAPLKDPAVRQRIVAAGDALARGDLVAGLPVVKACTAAALRHKETGIMKRPAALYEAVPEQAFVRGCETVAVAMRGVALALRVSCLTDVHARVNAEKRRRHLLGFDDMLRRLRDALTGSGPDGALARAIRARHDAALIDEFQDTDPFQFPIFTTAFAGRPLFLIGDPKQAIFAFRGADVHAYLAAARSADRQYTLGRNWRSTPRMIGAVNALFQFRRAPFLDAEIGFSAATSAEAPADPLSGDGRASLHWWLLPPGEGKNGEPEFLAKGKASDRERAALVREVVRLLSEPTSAGTPLAPAQIAVLVRSGKEGIAAQQALRAAGVPCIVAGLDDILKSRELHELESALRAVLTPADARTVRAAMATDMWGMSAHDIHALSLPEREGEWQALVERFAGWRELWLRFGFMRAAQAMLADLGVVERLLAHEDGERRVTNLRHAVELLHGAATEERLSPEGLLLWISTTRATSSEKAERTELRLETDAKAVQIVTIHKSKGLEFDVVFCPGLWSTWRTAADEPVLVHEGGAAVFDHGSPKREARGQLAMAEELAEELRLVYVALTRARLRCYLSWGAVKNRRTGLHSGHTALGWLLRATDEERTPTEAVADVPAMFESSLAQWDAPLHELVRRSDGAMTVEAIHDDAGDAAPRWTGADEERGSPQCRTDLPSGQSLRPWRIASFTSLTAGRQVEDARDVADAAEGARAWAQAHRPADFMDFPAGRLPGVALHELFERADFDADDDALRTLVGEVLHRAQLVDHEARIDAVTGMLRRVLGDTLPGTSITLRDVPRHRTLREWAFHLPLGDVSAELLGDAFSRHGDEVARRYAPALRRLSAERTHGFLTGVMDLAFEQEGRWYLVDWKSNQLGLDPAHYERAELEREMFASHYVLQYHLYVTALHRFLTLRVKDYDYDTHMGGAWYAFLRGVDGTGRGWFGDRPPRALVTALDALMTDSISSRGRPAA
ncbi:MAG TPA: exodeoxyribonuclease V subunit beta [Gemmatimonadaceae bacterium]|nr:exodeoxyribonuclease V subunit beta [Gemmatimonadaceae bacterium]